MRVWVIIIQRETENVNKKSESSSMTAFGLFSLYLETFCTEIVYQVAEYLCICGGYRVEKEYLAAVSCVRELF